MTAKTCVLITALVLANGYQANAQARPARHGAWIDAGLGLGSLHVSSDSLRGRNELGNDCYADIGLTLTSRLRAGVGFDQWTNKWGYGNQRWVTSANLLAYYYPFARRAFYLQATAARSDYLAVHVPPGGERADNIYFSGTAWGITGAAGWDIPVHGLLSARPALAYSYGPPRSLRADGTIVATGWRYHLMSLDLGFVLHQKDSQ